MLGIRLAVGYATFCGLDCSILLTAGAVRPRTDINPYSVDVTLSGGDNGQLAE